MVNISIYIYNLENSKVFIDSKDKLVSYLQDSYNFYKTFKGFEMFLKSLKIEDNKYVVDSNMFYLDHKKYCNLFLIFKDETDILYYVQDTCEARGEKIPQSIDQAFSYLKNDEVLVYKIEKFEVSIDLWNQIHDQYSKKKQS